MHRMSIEVNYSNRRFPAPSIAHRKRSLPISGKQTTSAAKSRTTSVVKLMPSARAPVTAASQLQHAIAT
jgi:hypothetical protein